MHPREIPVIHATADKTDQSTYDRVYHAAEQMLLAGRARDISVRHIAAQIGYGSSTTINKALDTWWTELGYRLKETQELPTIPEELQQQVAELLTTLKRTAVDTARQGLIDYERQADERVEAMQQQLELAQLAKTAAEQRAQTQADRNDAQEEKIRGLERLLVAEEGRRVELERSLDQARTDHANTREQLKKAEAERDDKKNELDTERGRAIASEERWVKQIDTAQQAQKDAEAALQNLHASTRGTETKFHEQLLAKDKVALQLDANLTAVVKERNLLLENKQALILKAERLEASLAAANETLLQERRRAGELEIHLAAAAKKMEESERKAQRLEEKLWQLAGRSKSKGQ